MQLSFNKKIETSIKGVCFHPNWKYVSLICDKKDINIYQLNNYESLVPVTKLNKHRNSIFSIDWSLLPKSYSNDSSYTQLISIGEDRLILLWILKEKKSVASIESSICLTQIEVVACIINNLQFDCYPVSCKFSPNSICSEFAVSTSSGDICIFISKVPSREENENFDFKRFYKFEQLKISISEFPLTCLVWSMDGKLLICGGLENKGVILCINNKCEDLPINNENQDVNLTENLNLEILSTVDSSNTILCCAISPKNNKIVFCDKDCYIYFTEINKNFENIFNLLKWDGLPFCNIKFLNQKFLIAVGHDCVPILFMQTSYNMWSHAKTINGPIMPLYLNSDWQNNFDPMQHYNQKSVHKRPINDVFSPDSETIICFGSDGEYSIWKIDYN